MIECSRSNCNLGGVCSNRMWAIGQAQSVELTINTAAGKGRGVFASESIAKGVLIREYVGDVIDDAETTRRVERNESKYIMELTGGMFIDASMRGNCSRFINHACIPNCQAQL
ncbi:hypothetical protein BBJ28_00002469 [Nothophytophthora sp. Chile5]|nr:hypothetical protein BBJ28_00002469 [Nothophytophthora sp. Chile5]